MINRWLTKWLLISSLLVTIGLLFGPVKAGWSDDPSSNLLIVGGDGGQLVPHIMGTADGGCYISWYDSSQGYDLRLQRLDALGELQWPTEGVLVADLNYSSVQDYALAVDGSDHAFLAYLDGTSGADQVKAQLVSASGDLLWGPSGVQLTNGSAFYGKPEAGVTGTGWYAVGWITDAGSVFQKLTYQGIPQWGAGIVVTDPAGGTLMVSDLIGAEDGAIIASFVQYLTFYGPKHLLAQKFDALGNRQWGTSLLSVFDSGSLQFGNYPELRSDGSGGAITSWYDTAGAILQCSVQHLRADGSEAFPHNGSVVSTSTSRQRVTPEAIYIPGTGETFSFWVEKNLSQSMSGVYGQKFDSDGNRAWGDSGIEIAAVDDREKSQLRVLPCSASAAVFYMDRYDVSNYQLRAAHLDPNGGFVWTPNLIDVSVNASDKTDLIGAVSLTGSALLVWSDGRNASDDIYGQKVNPDGSLGNQSPTATPTQFADPSPTAAPSITATPPEPSPTAWPSETPVPSPEPSPTIAVSLTPTSQPEPSPTAFPTSTPVVTLGVRLDLPLIIHPGELFYVTGYLDNPGPNLIDVPTFFLLDVYGEYWFWPSWSYFVPTDAASVDYRLLAVPLGTTVVPVLEAFIWPETGGDSLTDLRFWGAMLTSDLGSVLGDYAVATWGYKV